MAITDAREHGAQLYAMIYALSLLFGALAAQGAAGQTTGAPEAPLRSLVAQFEHGWNNGDARAVASMFTSSGDLILPGGKRAASQPAIERLMTEEYRDVFHGSTLNLTIQTIDFPDLESAVVAGQYRLSGIDVFAFIETSRSGPFTFHLRQQGDRWGILQARVSRE